MIKLSYLKDIEPQSEDERIIKYFFVFGGSCEEMSKLSNNELLKKTPKILSSYSTEGKTEEFLTLQETMNVDPFYRHCIFPMEANYFEDLFIDDRDIDEIHIKKDTFHDYLILDNEKPKPFFHSVELKNWSNFCYVWHFHCLITYDFLKKDKESQKKIYIPKALIIVTHEPYITLCKMVLEKIYEIYSKDLQLPIEVYILYIINVIRKTKSEKTLIETVYAFSDTQFYCLKEEKPFLGVLDINFSIFFKMFNIKEVLVIAEQFVRNKNLLVISKNQEILYPFYLMLMTVVHPLGITDNTYFYKFLTPETLQYLFSDFPFMMFMYYKGEPQNFQFENIVKQTKADLIVVRIEKFKSMYLTNAKVYKYIEQKNGMGQVESSILPKTNLFLDILSYQQNSMNNYSILINELAKFKDLKNNVNIFSQGNFDLIRQCLFSLMVNFFISLIQTIFFKIKDNAIDILVKLNDNYSMIYNIKDISSTPIFDIIYKANIINNPNLKFIILRDEIIKISQIDKDRVYYDFSFAKKPIERKVIMLYNFSFLEQKQFYYINKLNRFMQRHLLTKEKIIPQGKYQLSCSFYKEEKRYLFHYTETKFYFDIFATQKEKNDLEKEKEINFLFVEIETFYNLYNSNSIPIIVKKETATCAICFALSIILLYEVRSSNINHQLFLTHFNILYIIFLKTEGFFKKFNCLLSILYQIIISDETLASKYKEDFIKKLSEFKIVPTITIYVKYNSHKTYYIKKNDNLPPLNYYINSQNELEVPSNYHNHYFNYEKNINGEYECEECKDPLQFRVDDSTNCNKVEFLLNPNIVIKRLLNYSLHHDILNISNINDCYPEWFDDLCQISYYSNIYFDIEVLPNLEKILHSSNNKNALYLTNH